VIAKNLKTRLLIGYPYYLITFGVSGILIFFLVADTLFISMYEVSTSNDKNTEAWIVLFYTFTGILAFFGIVLAIGYIATFFIIKNQF